MLDGTKEERDEEIKETAVAKWLRENREKRDHYAGIRRFTRGSSFGREKQKVIILFK